MITRPSIALRLFLIWTSWLVLPTWFGRLSAQESDLPLWKQGVSRFNGTGYDLPSVSPAPLNLTPYTVPSTPSESYEIALNAAQTPSVKPAATDTAATPKSSEIVAPLPPPVRKPDSGDPDSSAKDSSAKAAESSSDLPVATSDLPVATSDLPVATSDLPVATSEALPGDIVLESPPLEEDVVRWYQYPVRWMKGWDSNAEFGIDGSDGNSNTLAIQTGMELKRKTERSTWSMDLDYRQANSRNVTTENNGRLNLDYDRLLADSDFSGFGKFGMEWDKFKPFDLRLNLNAGLGYHWLRTDDATLVTRFGAGASREIGAPIDEWTPEGVFGLEAERQLTRRQKLKGKLDYFPAWEDFGDYRLVTDVSWEVLLDGSENLSLKLAATDRYDSTPQGARPNDLYYSLLLLYKF